MGIQLSDAGVEVNRIWGNRDAANEPLCRTWFNRAYQILTKAREFPDSRATTTINTAAGVATIAKPADYYSVVTLKDQTNDQRLVQVSGRRYDTFDITEEGFPEYYHAENAANFELWRVPSGIFTMFLRYRKKYDDLTDAAHTSDLDTEWDQILIFLASALAFTDSNEFERAQAMEREAGILIRRIHDPLAEELFDRDEPVAVIGLYGSK